MNADDEDYDHSEAEIIWEGNPPSGDVVARVRANIKAELVDLATPTDLMFHIILLSEIKEGPSVTLFGIDGGRFGGEYCEHTEWVPLDSD